MFETSVPPGKTAALTLSTKKPKISVTVWVGNSSEANTNFALTALSFGLARVKLKEMKFWSKVVFEDSVLSAALAPVPGWGKSLEKSGTVFVVGRLACPDVSK